MEKRYYKRIHVSIDIIIFLDNSIYYGTLNNCSANGMYIETPFISPLNSLLKILIPSKKEMVKVTAKVVRRANAGTTIYQGMGVESINLSNEYLQFIIKLNHES